MSVLSNPSIVTNGLVFQHDMNNINSYRSPPLKNFLTTISPRGQGNSSTYKFSDGTESVYIPNLGNIQNCVYMDMYNDYNGGSNNCCPSPFGYGNDLTISPSTLYTYAIVYKSVNGYTHPNYMYHYEYTSGGSYLTEYGVFYSNGTYSGQVRHLGDDWYWASSTFTSNASAGFINTGAWMYEYGRYNRLYIAKAMLVAGNYTNLHPKFWPPLATTVSNTQTLLDLTRNNTITAQSLTYASDGTFSFNGSSNYMDISTAGLTGTGSWTMGAWFKINGAPSNTLWQNVIVDTDATGGSANMIAADWGGVHGGSQNQLLYATRPSTGGAYTYLFGPVLTQGVWYHAMVVRNGATDTKLYVNGTLNNTYSGNMPTATQPLVIIGRWTDGTNYANASIPSVQIYNRALSASEVLQNFSSQRGLYGV